MDKHTIEILPILLVIVISIIKAIVSFFKKHPLHKPSMQWQSVGQQNDMKIQDDSIDYPKEKKNPLEGIFNQIRETVVAPKKTKPKKTKKPVVQPIMADELASNAVHHKTENSDEPQCQGLNLNLCDANEAQKAIVYSEIFKQKF